jgi:uncharacterized protein YdhG (YjbR/CyaY superfamily)
MKPKPTSIDAYLATVTGPQKATLEKLRTTLRAVVPKAQECISYNLPAFRLGDEVVAGFSATAKGCSYYPFSGSTLRTVAKDVKGYTQTRGALHFAADKALPVALVRKLVKARLAELATPARRRT